MENPVQVNANGHGLSRFGARLPRLVALLEAWTMVFQLTRWVDLRRSLSTWRRLKNMMLLLLQTDKFLHLQATLLKSVRLHPHRGQQLARSQGLDGKPNKRRKRLSDGSVGLAEAMSKFAESSAKIEAMKIEIQKEIASLDFFWIYTLCFCNMLKLVV
jgi:hypothetical protein